MAKETAISSIIPNRRCRDDLWLCYNLNFYSLFFLCEANYSHASSFFRHSNVWIYLCGIAFISCRIAHYAGFIGNKNCRLFAGDILFGLAVSIDLRGLFNTPDDLKYIYAQAF